MALIACRDCGTEVSTSAKACPKCGAPPPQWTATPFGKMIAKAGLGGVLIVVVAIAWVWTWISSKLSLESVKSPLPIAQVQPLITEPQKPPSEGGCSSEQRQVAKQLVILSGLKCDSVSFCSGSYPRVRVTCNQNLFAYRIVDKGEGTVVELD